MLLFASAYFVSYLTRINFGAVISEMESATGFTKDVLSISVTGSFITYGIGQLISGYLGDRISPKKLVLYGFIITVLMNTAIPFCPSPYAMAAVWCANGFAQSLMWPPIVKLMTILFTAEEYKKVCQRVILGSTFATIVIYLTAPALIWLFGWKSVFFFSAICGAVMIFFWQKYCEDVKNHPLSSDADKVKSKVDLRPLFCPAMIGIMVAIILQGMLKDGITTWMPTYIEETYKLGNEISILTGVVMPIFSAISVYAATALYTKKFTNPVFCGGVIFTLSIVASATLIFVTGKSAALSVAASAVVTGSMHGVNLMLICMIPAFFKKFDFVSTGSGVINACTYIGSSLSTYGIAVMSQNYGWSFTLKIWFVLAVVGTAACFVSSNPWKKKFM